MQGQEPMGWEHSVMDTDVWSCREVGKLGYTALELNHGKFCVAQLMFSLVEFGYRYGISL
jgi:hypothetical protein